jgi:hypothetical protein
VKEGPIGDAPSTQQRQGIEIYRERRRDRMEEAGGGRHGARRRTDEAGGATQMRLELRAPSPTRRRAASSW